MFSLFPCPTVTFGTLDLGERGVGPRGSLPVRYPCESARLTGAFTRCIPEAVLVDESSFTSRVTMVAHYAGWLRAPNSLPREGRGRALRSRKIGGWGGRMSTQNHEKSCVATTMPRPRRNRRAVYAHKFRATDPSPQHHFPHNFPVRFRSISLTAFPACEIVTTSYQ